MQIATIVLNWNGKDDTLACLDSLKQCDTHIVLVDNGSLDDSLEALAPFHPIATGKNLGYAGGNNVGIAHAFKEGADAVIILNNDVLVDPKMVEAFVAMHAKHPSAILGGNTYLMSSPEEHDAIGGMWNPKTCNFDLCWQSRPDLPLDYVTGCCLFLPRAIYEVIGGFEERYFLYWEDADLCMRAKKANFKVLHCADAKLWHKGSASMVGGKPHHTYFWWRGRLLFNQLHGTRGERLLIYKEILRLFKHYTIKLCQSKLLPFLRKEVGPKRTLALCKYRAAFQGISDYFSNKFGNAPSHILRRIEN